MSAQPKQPWEVMNEAMDKIFGAFERAPDLERRPMSDLTSAQEREPIGDAVNEIIERVKQL